MIKLAIFLSKFPLNTTILCLLQDRCLRGLDGHCGKDGSERNQVRADLEQLDMRGHLRQFLRGRVPLHDASDVCVWCTDVQTGIADAHCEPPLGFRFLGISACIFLGNPSVTHRTSGYHWLRWRHRPDFSLCRSVRRRRFG